MDVKTAKRGVGLYVDLAAVVLAVVGVVLMVVSSSMGAGYEFTDMPLYLVAVVVAIALVLVAAWLDARQVEKGPSLAAMFALGAAIFLLVYAGIQVVGSRVLTISGLFSWNSADATGWSMFYAAVASTACLVVSAVTLTVGSFLPLFKRS